MKQILFSCGALALALCVPAAAQRAGFTTFGSGCAGTSGLKQLTSNHGTATQLEPGVFAQTSEVAIPVAGISSPLVMGFEILTKAILTKSNVTAHAYRSDKLGYPLSQPATSGVMTVGTQVGWYRVAFTKPLVLSKGETFFISWTDPKVPLAQVIAWPNPKGVRGNEPVFHRFSATGPWVFPAPQNAWAWRVLGPGTALSPTLSNLGLPKLGSSYTVALSNARATTACSLISGFSASKWLTIPLPLDLTPLGAPGCLLLTSYDITAFQLTSATGQASVTIPVPNDTRLAGLNLHHQWMVFDQTANPLQFLFSGGGTATFGN